MEIDQKQITQLSKLSNIISSDVAYKSELIEINLRDIDLLSLASYLLEDNNLPNDTSYEYIKKYLDVLEYIELYTNIGSLIPDTLFDKLNEKFVSLQTNNDLIPDNKTINHSFPELRGTLDKVHFIYNKDIPDNDNRKSLQSWLDNIDKKINYEPKSLFVDFKYDGVSCVLECSHNEITNAITRGTIETNTGQDITHIFKNFNTVLNFDIDNANQSNQYQLNNVLYNLTVEDVLTNKFENSSCDQTSNFSIFNNLTKNIIDMLKHFKKYAIKCEIIMLKYNFDEYNNVTDTPVKNHRSAVSSIINTSKSEYTHDYFKYLTIVPVQISIDNDIPISEKNKLEADLVKFSNVNPHIVYIGNGISSHIQSFIRTSMLAFYEYNITNNNKFLKSFLNIIETSRDESERLGIPIDGLVITVIDEPHVKILGRENDRNKFQVAYKFPPVQKKTILEDVKYQVGIHGRVTPVAIINPVVINGNTISHVNLYNLAYLEEMNLTIGSEVIVNYDIIPVLSTDDTCKVCKDGSRMGRINNCPLCNETLVTEGKITKCVNKDCISFKAGRVLNYIEKMGIPNIGISIIEDFMRQHIIVDIPDLYTIEEHMRYFKMDRIEGYSDKSLVNIINSINSRRKVFPHVLLGAIGMPQVGKITMKKILNVVYIDTLLNLGEERLFPILYNIKGIGKSTATNVINGIETNKDLILKLLSFVELMDYPNQNNLQVVVFSGIRDNLFSSFLESKGMIVDEKITDATTLLIVKEYNIDTPKVQKAIENNIDILSLNDAKIKFNYTK